MAFDLTQFRIDRLHGRRSFDLRIDGNKLVLVGENGTGKTTVINILYYFLSRQWPRLAQYEFEKVTAVIDGREYVVKYEWLRNIEWLHESSHRRVRGHLSPRVVDQLYTMIAAEGGNLSMERLRQFAARWDVPVAYLRDVAAEMLHHDPQRTELFELSEALTKVITDQILYLPTYRRIEQDLKSIFPGLDESVIRKRVARHAGRGGFIELVEFGMEDVETAVAEKMNQLKERVRTGLDALTTAYLRDVIGGEYKSLSSESIKPEELEGIEAVFSRIDERTLPTPAKDRLREIVARIQQRQWVEDEQKVIVWFLLRLLELHRRQQAAEVPVRQFIEICNRYLVGKRCSFDSNEFAITIALERIGEGMPPLDGPETITFRDLSSGEKQIVSLFGHLLLAGSGDYFVLIDEPELSLSVPWQTRFLPDVLSTGRCNGIVAVTHSPFVFDNELDSFGRNITDFVTQW